MQKQQLVYLRDNAFVTFIDQQIYKILNRNERTTVFFQVKNKTEDYR